MASQHAVILTQDGTIPLCEEWTTDFALFEGGAKDSYDLQRFWFSDVSNALHRLSGGKVVSSVTRRRALLAAVFMGASDAVMERLWFPEPMADEWLRDVGWPPSTVDEDMRPGPDAPLGEDLLIEYAKDLSLSAAMGVLWKRADPTVRMLQELAAFRFGHPNDIRAAVWSGGRWRASALTLYDEPRNIARFVHCGPWTTELSVRLFGYKGGMAGMPPLPGLRKLALRVGDRGEYMRIGEEECARITANLAPVVFPSMGEEGSVLALRVVSDTVGDGPTKEDERALADLAAKLRHTHVDLYVEGVNDMRLLRPLGGMVRSAKFVKATPRCLEGEAPLFPNATKLHTGLRAVTVTAKGGYWSALRELVVGGHDGSRDIGRCDLRALGRLELAEFRPVYESREARDCIILDAVGVLRVWTNESDCQRVRAPRADKVELVRSHSNDTGTYEVIRRELAVEGVFVRRDPAPFHITGGSAPDV